MPTLSQLESWWRQASESLAAGAPAKALPLLKKLAASMPADPAVHYNLGACLIELGRPGEAFPHLKRAQDRGFAAAGVDPLLARVARAMHAASRFDDAIAILQDIVLRRPDDVGLLLQLAVVLREAGRFRSALEILERARATGREVAEVLNAIGTVHQNLGALDAARATFCEALAIDARHATTKKNIRFLTMNLPGIGPDEYFACYRSLGLASRQSGAENEKFPGISHVTGRRLKIAYISSDFRMHVVGLNLLPLVENSDLAAVEMYFYSDVPQDDLITARFKAKATGWRSIVGCPDSEVAEMIRNEKIDIAVYLAGALDNNRAQLAAYRCAPIQVSFHDGATSGLDEMDYWLTDLILHPAETTEQFVESLYRLPVFYQYFPPEPRIIASVPPSVRTGVVTFGSFSKPEKINEGVVALWARILAAVPRSCLLLKYFDFYRGPEAQSLIMDRFAEQGVTPDRVVFRAGYDNRGTHLALYDEIDIALDPFPFTGATTTFEALSSGVPVVSLSGTRFVGRMACSIITHAGFPEFVCPDADAYLETACALAKDPARLGELRRLLPERIAASPLCDGPAYARMIEAAYREMWVRFCAASS